MHATHGDGHEPGSQGASILEALQRRARVEEGLLHQIVDVGVIAQDAIDDARHVPRMAPVQSAEGLLVRGGAPDEGGVGLGVKGKREVGQGFVHEGATKDPDRLKKEKRAGARLSKPLTCVTPIVKSRRDLPRAPAAPPPEPRRFVGVLPSGWLDGGTLAVCLLLFFGGIGHAGLWESVELDLAERARTTLDGGAAARAVALGYRLFGVSATGGRLALAACVLAGALAIFAVCACLEDAATARIATLLFASTPMIFVHARTLRADAVSMGAVAVAFAGLGIAALDERASLGKRIPALLVGLLGLGAGYATEGPLLGVAAPGAAIALAWLLGSGEARRRGTVFGVVAFVTALVGVGLGWRGAATLAHPPFDHVLAEVAHGCFPWSALLPLALASASSRPLSRAAWLFAAAVFAAQSWLGRGGVLPVAFAIVLATAFAKERTTRPWSRFALAAVVAAATLLVQDFRHLPEKDLAAYGTSLAVLPTSAKALAERGYMMAAALLGVGALLAAVRVRGQRVWLFGATLVAALVLRFG